MTSNTCTNELVRRTSWTWKLRSQELSATILSSQKIESWKVETLPERKRVNEATLPRRAQTADDADLSQKNGRAKFRLSTKHPNTSYSVLRSICSCLHLFLEWRISNITHWTLLLKVQRTRGSVGWGDGIRLASSGKSQVRASVEYRYFYQYTLPSSVSEVCCVMHSISSQQKVKNT